MRVSVLQCNLRIWRLFYAKDASGSKMCTAPLCVVVFLDLRSSLASKSAVTGVVEKGEEVGEDVWGHREKPERTTCLCYCDAKFLHLLVWRQVRALFRWLHRQSSSVPLAAGHFVGKSRRIIGSEACAAEISFEL
jgi:hypothetical protein